MMQEVFKKLDSFKLLEENWDSYGALPIDPDCIERAKSFLLAIGVLFTPPLWPCPTSHGGVQFEWNHNGKDLEIAFEPEGALGIFYTDTSSDYQYEMEFNTTDTNRETHYGVT